MLLWTFATICFILGIGCEAKLADLNAVQDLKQQFFCPDNISTCLTGQTCCKFSFGGYGCCGYNVSTSTCCADNFCCEKGFQCNNYQDSCDNLAPTGYIVSFPGYGLDHPVNAQVPLIQKINNVCSDNRLCFVNYTCCSGPNGSSCCPFNNGTCCKGKNDLCCPYGFQCDEDNENCYSLKDDSDRIAFANGSPAYNHTSVETCQDNSSHCSAGQTCCELENSSYGCCVIADGVCCPNKKYCCPSGYKCDDDHGLCIHPHSAP